MEGFLPYFDGHHAVYLLDDNDYRIGELVWRLAHLKGIAEITHFGIDEIEDRRRGGGTLMMQSAISDIIKFMKQIKIKPRSVYALTSPENGTAKGFYKIKDSKR